jgi:hypothetical protein
MSTPDGIACRDVSDDSIIEDGGVDASRKRNFDNVTCRHDSTSRQCDDLDRTSKRIKFSAAMDEVSIENPDTVVSTDSCNDCRALNLDALIRTINEPGGMERQWPAPWYTFPSLWYPEEPHWPRASVGHRYKSAQSSSCVLCRVLARSRLDKEYDAGSDGCADEDVEFEIYLEPVRLPIMTKPSREAKEAMYLITVPRGSGLSWRWYDQIQSKGCAVLLSQPARSELFIPKTIPRMFNADLVGSWTRYCASNHKLLCGKDILPVRGVRVIDCNTRHIVYWDGNAPYVSLSYVWGTTENTCGAIEDGEGRQSLPKLLPRVITDSIEVTKALGYQYLRIDKFCIAQDSPDLKHEQIQQMDAVYHNSDLTIISAAGLDESNGLPGVGTTSRCPQLVANLGGASVLYAPKDPEKVIKQSHWSTRGWTFQEAVLSRRRLVFTEDQMYFQRDTMNCFESVHCPLDEIHVRDKSKTYSHIRDGLFNRNEMVTFDLVHKDEPLLDSFCRYMSNVEDYSSRTLRFAEDSLNAFQGILRRFSRRQVLENVWGLAYPTNCSDSLRYFVHALAWIHRRGTIPQRRNMFPSWAWAGWEGPVDYGTDIYTTLIDSVKYLCELRFRTAAGRLVEFEDLNGTDHHPILQVKANTIPSSHIAYQPEKSSETPWLVFGCVTALSLSGGNPSEGDLLQSLQNESQWQCIVINRTDLFSWVMIIRAQPDGITWERAGMFQVIDLQCFDERLRNQVMRTFEIS